MANPKLAMIPTGYKAGKVYSVLPESGVGDFTFDRDSKATRVNEDGLIEVMDNDVPRLDYTDGGCPSLLLEPERTNLIQYSEDFSQSYWSKSASTITSNAAISPDGTLNASLFESTGAAGYMYPSTGILSSAANGTFTYSIYAKEGNTSSFTILISAAANYTGDFNLTSVEASTSTANTIVDISNAGNGWYRCSVTASLVASSAYSELQIGRISLGSNLYFYGTQLEQGEYATSYIPTNGSTKTRVGETCNGAGDASTFNDSEGVLMFEISALANDNTFRNICISDGSASDKIQFYYRPDANQITMLITASSSIQAAETIRISSTLVFNKIVIKYKQNDFQLWVNGFKVATDTNGITPIGLSELAFDDGVGSSAFYGKTKQLQYFNSTLTDAELETLTSWQSFSEMANGQNYTII